MRVYELAAKMNMEAKTLIKKLGELKFGEVRDDGTIKVPNPWTLKWTCPYYLRLTEHQSMWIMYILTTIFGVIGLSVT